MTAFETSRYRDLWELDPTIHFLNHGSFGACPKSVLAHQSALRLELESEPVRFMHRELGDRLDAARQALAAYLCADPQGLVFVSNATAGVNTVLRSLKFAPGDEILVTDHGYPACTNAAHFVAESGARVVTAHVPFPIESPDQVVDAILEAVTERTKLALIDHVTSPTGLIFPIERIVRELDARGIDTLVDGAHAPGMLALDLHGLGAAYYTGNCHKWLCAPKGAAFLVVRADRRDRIRPLSISHGARATLGDRSRFLVEGDWTGTHDPTPYLSIPAALDFGRRLLPGGWPAWRIRNRELALFARDRLCDVLGHTTHPAPDSMLGNLAAVPLPDATGPHSGPPHFVDPFHLELFDKHRIEVPIFGWPRWPARLLRVSGQIYVGRESIEVLVGVCGERFLG